LLLVTGTAPWIARIAEIKAALAVNVEAERKVASLNDEMQGLARSLRTKDQTIQESAVKIELMERRLEAVKKQADTIVELENELIKARKQERAYEEAMEQLQADLDALEQDNAKLKTMTAGQERQCKFCGILSKADIDHIYSQRLDQCQSRPKMYPLKEVWRPHICWNRCAYLTIVSVIFIMF